MLICDGFSMTYWETVTNNADLSSILRTTVVDIQPKAHYTLTYTKDPQNLTPHTCCLPLRNSRRRSA
jgi:hypothetical protein